MWNPSGTGVSLHVLVNDNIPNAGDACTNIWTDFDSKKNSYLGTSTERSNPNHAQIKSAKMHTYHYGLFIHSICSSPTSSGVSEVFGNDFVISFGNWLPDGLGTVSEQESAMMHELGHNLNLLHGGNVIDNCKPNHLSVMSYAFEFTNFVANRPLDFSKSTLASLNENSLIESDGIRSSAPSGLKSAYGPPGVLVTQALNAPSPYKNPIDWNRDGDTLDTGVVKNINKFDYGDCTTSTLSTLFGFWDWASLSFWGIGGTFADGAPQGSTHISHGLLHHDLTFNDIRNSRLILLQGIHDQIQKIPNGQFRDQNHTAALKSDFGDKINSIAPLLKSDKLDKAISKLQDINSQSKSSLIPQRQAQVQSQIDNLILALEKQK